MKINPMHCGMQLSSILRSHNRKVKKRFLQIMFHCFKVLLVPHCFLHKTPTGIGMAWAPHLPKPLARENAQPSECYVCTIEGFKNTELSSLNSSRARLFSLLKRTIYKKKLVHTLHNSSQLDLKMARISDIFFVLFS